mmetsp:Transcript_24479/g.69766  ORF Transcript_24479/g.69766 Transcript_24479/m.69766 type:complete len:274 (+) Transcript_24479:88-909(+)
MMAPNRRLSAVCRKTKMCKHAAAGSCPHGAACAFTHDPSELECRPDLARTKMCPVLARSGRCSDKACTFAHSKDEMRRVILAHRVGARQRREHAPPNDAAKGLPDAQRIPLPRVQRQGKAQGEAGRRALHLGASGHYGLSAADSQGSVLSTAPPVPAAPAAWPRSPGPWGGSGGCATPPAPEWDAAAEPGAHDGGRSAACHATPSQRRCGSDASTSEGSARRCGAESDSDEEGEDGFRIVVRNTFVHAETRGGRRSCRARSAPPVRGDADDRV